ncbi:hypothetical protein [Streptomyces cavernae]|uniref:hypothetical protein n=1 Tax=Streptomyces cavernae TaxID=2259034 RepID=UPI000FEC1C1B|nr:hypothetical protein [Streptomyces cavernae]
MKGGGAGLYGRAVDCVVARFEGVDASFRHEVALTARQVSVEGEAGRSVRFQEVCSLVGLALRLRSRFRTGGRGALVWRQGGYLGAVLLMFVGAAAAWGETAVRGGVGGVGGLLAVGLAGAAGCALAGPVCRAPWSARGLALVPAGCAVVALAGRGPDVLSGMCAVAAGGLALGSPPPVPAGRGVALGLALLPCLAWPLAVAVGAGAMRAGVLAVLTGVVPGVLIVLGWFDARLAAMGAVVWFARLVVGDLGALGDALLAAGDGEQRLLLLRWALMSSGVALAWLVARRSIRELGRL